MKEKLPLYKLLFASGLGTGFLKPAPGTWGTLLGMILFALIQLYIPVVKTVIWIVLFILAHRWIGPVENKFGEDAPLIVIDEILGIGLVLIFIDFTIWHWIIAFIAFRFFDILKPFGIDNLQNIKGAKGVIYDDILAGFYSLVFIFALQYFGVFIWLQQKLYP